MLQLSRMTLTETVPYVGATAVQASGPGRQWRHESRVLDSGIDYTHRSFGWPRHARRVPGCVRPSSGDPKNTTRDGLFPTAKVVVDIDFVGEQWPNWAAAHRIPIRSMLRDRVVVTARTWRHHRRPESVVSAPGAKLLCGQGVQRSQLRPAAASRLLQGMDFALDPNGDGDTAMRSTSSTCRWVRTTVRFEDDLSLAATNAVKLGVVVVTSAGNGANKPYIVGSPSIAPGVISVAQTRRCPARVALSLVINRRRRRSPGSNPNTADGRVGANHPPASGCWRQVGRGCPAAPIARNPAAAPYLASPDRGRIALIDRGTCSVSLKVGPCRRQQAQSAS